MPDSTHANEIGFIERFVLAPDRDAALKELIPGTEQYYYYHALHYQNEGRNKELGQTLEQWRKRYENSNLRTEIENREALIGFKDNPGKSIKYLQEKLGLRFTHTQEQRDPEVKLPSALDQKHIAYEVFLKNGLREKTLSDFNDAALPRLVRDGAKLKVAQRRELLKRIARPDVPGLVDLIVADLKTKESGGFGEFQIHRNLLVVQLDQLREALPKFGKNETFVLTYLGKLVPGADVDMRRNAKEREAYLERAWKFVADLPPAFNSLKAHILFARLEHDLGLGKPNEKRFLEYVKLPRPVDYIEPRYREREELWRFPCDLGRDFQSTTSFRPIGHDHQLVRAYLLHFFVKAGSYDKYSDYIRDTFLKPLFAEAKIVNGVGDQEKWFSMLDPSAYQALKDRVDIEFDRSCKKQFAVGEKVSLDVHTKNVRDLIVKIYEINTYNYYAQFGKQLGTDLNLDGLVPNEEKTHSYEDAPLRRVERTFEFPQLAGRRGVWIVEFIGNSKSSRAVIKKGGLQFLTRSSSKGNVLTVLDEDNKVVTDAFAFFGGKRYDAADGGEIALPFTSQPGSQKVILGTPDGFASLVDFP